MDELIGRVVHLETSTATIVADVAEMKPVTDGVKRWKPMGIGALGVTGIVGMALGVSFGEEIRGIVLAIGGRFELVQLLGCENLSIGLLRELLRAKN